MDRLAEAGAPEQIMPVAVSVSGPNPPPVDVAVAVCVWQLSTHHDNAIESCIDSPAVSVPESTWRPSTVRMNATVFDMWLLVTVTNRVLDRYSARSATARTTTTTTTMITTFLNAWRGGPRGGAMDCIGGWAYGPGG